MTQNYTNLMQETFETIGPTCLKHPDGRYGVLWFSQQSTQPYAVFPRHDFPTPLEAIRQDIKEATLFAQIEDIVAAGWRVD